ncbi:hypothetical protein KW799_02120 [Candidatus Parcubacteria bacterium]|nr:hypothetical protein [Candidatus Parcubacteria bacterium]
MAYQNEGLVARLQRKLELTPEQATALFEDTKRFLYICGLAPTGSGFSPTPIIDEGWHNFILFTKDYEEFCLQFFDRFIHHVPKNKAEGEIGGKYSGQRTLAAAKKIFGETLSANWVYSDTADCCEKCSPSTNCQSRG